jgi:Na+/H+ antiporter NhaC
MRKVTDNHKVPREFLAYVINSTGAAVCVLIPFSTWAAFMAGQLDANGVTVAGSATAAFIKIIPYVFYGWMAVLIVPLFSLKIIPLFGPMKKAVKRAEETGEVFPESTRDKKEEFDAVETSFKGKPKVLNFLVPMATLAVITVITQDMLLGVFISIAICFVLFIPQKLMGFGEFFDSVLNGFKDMLLVLWIIVAAFFLQKANEGLGLTPFVIEAVEPILNARLLPVASFIIIGFLAFATGSFWGVAAIAFPIIIPLATAMDVNVYLVCGAIVSAAALGSHTCFYGDAVTLSCASSQIQNSDYAKTSIPIIAVPFALAVILYLVFGFIG